jgi:transcription antitermination factor NusG
MRLWQTARRCKARAWRGRLFALARTPEPRIMVAAMAASHITTSGLVEDWPDGFSGRLPDAHWLVVHAYPRQEKKLILELRARRLPGCAFFERRIRHYPGKGTQESLVPLLGGYVFVAAPLSSRQDIYETHRVVRIIEVPRPDELARDLRSLCQLVAASDAPLQVRPELTAGKRVEITAGTFAGCSGVITRRQGQIELVVNLEMLGTSVAVTLPANLAELAAAP